MKIKFNRDLEVIDTKSNKITIIIDDINYNISQTIEGSLIINKASLEDSKISIFPYMSNQIEII